MVKEEGEEVVGNGMKGNLRKETVSIRTCSDPRPFCHII